MRSLHWNIALTVLLGVGLGLFGGQATIAGMTPAISTETIGGGDPPTGPNYAAALPEAPAPAPEHALVAEDCAECSDYDLGYRFAAARGVRDSGECMEFSWSYQRGCLARLRED